MRRCPADDIKREMTQVTQALARDRTDVSRIRLAMLYTLTRSPADDQRALQLLENVARSGGGPSPLKQLAALLQPQVAERARAVRDEQARANEAVQKLEALRQMERSLLRDRLRGGGGGGGGGGWRRWWRGWWRRRWRRWRRLTMPDAIAMMNAASAGDVLLVDDDPDLLRLIGLRLTSAG